LPNRGYRFVAAVTPVSSAPPVASPPPQPAENFADRYLRWRPLAMALGLVIIGFALWLTRPDAPVAPQPHLRIAILPFENLSPDPDNAFFADGLHEEILTSLARRAPSLAVVSRTTMMSYRQKPRPAREVAQELGATHLLEGSVRREAQNV